MSESKTSTQSSPMIFLNPQHPQPQSRLVQLPIELLLIVLRLLLHFPHDLFSTSLPEDSLEEGNVRAQQRRKIRAGGRLMRTCQSLYQECLIILYEENTAGICVDAYDGVSGCVLGMCFEGKETMFIGPGNGGSNLGINYLIANTSWTKHGRAALTRAFTAVSRFSRVAMLLQIPEDYGVDRFIFWLCRSLCDVLKDKSVTFILDFENKDVRIGSKQLYGFRILRCRSIEFIGHKVPKRLIDLLEDPMKVRDLCDRWLDLTDELEGLPSCKYGSFVDKYEDTLLRLNVHAYRYDKEKYIKCEEVLVSYARIWREDWHEDNVNNIQQRLDHARELVEDFQDRLVRAESYARDDKLDISKALEPYDAHPQDVPPSFGSRVNPEASHPLEAELEAIGIGTSLYGLGVSEEYVSEDSTDTDDSS